MKHSKFSNKLARRIATLCIALLFILGGLFSGAFAPMLRDFVANAASTTASNVANYSISRLPSKTMLVTTPIPVTQPVTGSDTVFAVYWVSSNTNYLVGVGQVLPNGANANGINNTQTAFTASGVSPDLWVYSTNSLTFSRAGTYVYQFYKASEFISGYNAATKTTTATSFYSYPVTIEATEWKIVLPENSEDIIPNVIFPGMPIKFPLPESIFDRKGNDLLDLDENENVTLLKDALVTIYKAGATLPLTDSTNVTAESQINGATNAQLKAMLYSQVKLNFYNNGTPMDPKAAGTINNPDARTFTPPSTSHGDRFYAEYSIEIANITASLSTNNIMVDSTAKTSINWGGDGVIDAQKKNVWFEKSPAISKTLVDGDFDVNVETTLPKPTVNLLARADIPEENSQRANAIEFTSATNVTNYTFVTVRFHGKGSDWTHGDRFMWIGDLDANGKVTLHENEYTGPASARVWNARRITDFKFTPHDRGEYEFYYYTTTMFGTGRDQENVDRFTQGTTSYIRHTPFDQIKIARDSVRPTMKWTSDFDYIPGETGIDNGNVVMQGAQYLYKVTPTEPSTRKEEVRSPERAYYDAAYNAGKLYYDLDAKGQRQLITLGADNKITIGTVEVPVAEEYRTSDTTNRVYASKSGDYTGAADDAIKGEPVRYGEEYDAFSYLPSTSSSGSTAIAEGGALVIPALFGDDNVTKSENMHYLMSIYKHENGGRTGTPVTFEDGKKLDSSNNLTSARPTTNATWNHNETLRIYFDEYNFGRGTDTETENRLLKGFGDQRFDITGTYEIWVRCYDNDMDGRNLGTQYNFYFEVKPTSLVGGIAESSLWKASTPEAQGLFRIGQNEYYKGDTITFNTASFRDDHTDANRIEITYHLSFKDPNNGDEFGHDLGEHVVPTENIEGGRVTIEITEDNEIGAAIIAAMGTSAVAEFRIYAIARNYHAIVNGVHYDDYYTPTGEQKFVAAVYDVVTVYDLNYGEAAVITSNEWNDYFNAVQMNSGTANEDPQAGDTKAGFEGSQAQKDKLVKQNNRVYLPAFEFAYTTAGIYSSITFEIIQPQGGSVIGANIMKDNRRIGGGWQGLFPDASGKTLTLGDSISASNDPTLTNPAQSFANRRFFIPTQIGLHMVVVTCTNAGGNVAIYVGQINIKGKPQYQATLKGTADTASMRIGMIKSLPDVEITINGDVFRSSSITDERGTIVTTEPMSVKSGNTILRTYPAGTEVGKFTIISGSLNGNAPKWSNNRFAPIYADDYEFEYAIEITDNLQVANDKLSFGTGSVAGELLGGIDFTTRLVHTAKVSKLDASDILINLQSQDYRALAARNKFTASEIAAIEAINDDFALNPKNKVNTFEQMLVSGAEGKTLSISDEQLFESMMLDNGNTSTNPNDFGNYEPKSGSSGMKAKSTWNYGKIYLPNFNLDLHENVKEGLFGDFTGKDVYGNPKVESYITVQFSGQSDDEYLLNTQKDKMPSTYEQVKDANGISYHWFRPYGGKSVPTPVASKAEGGVYEDLYGNWYTSEPSEWNNTDAVDGEYTITYTAIYQNTTSTLTYKIAMGDTEAPRINFWEDKEKELFDDKHKLDSEFTFNTSWLTIQGGKTVWTGTEGRDYIKDKLSVLIYDPNGYTVNLSRNANQTLDDGYYIKGESDGYDTYKFKLLIPGEYRITYTITSKSGMSAVRSKTITVLPEEVPTKWDVNEIMGTILIILSSGLLIGVIIYFIRTGSTTKFQGAHSKKEKEEKPDAVV